MNQPFDENVYLIDLSYVKTAAEIIFDLSTILDTEEARNRRICLKLGTIELNQSQILSVKSLINSINSTLSFVDTDSENTKNAVLSLGIVLATKTESDKLKAQEPEMIYKNADEIEADKQKDSLKDSEEADEIEDDDPELEYLRNKFETQTQDVPVFQNKFEKVDLEKKEDEDDEKVFSANELETEQVVDSVSKTSSEEKPMDSVYGASSVFDSENIPDEYEQLSQDDYIIPADEPSSPREYDKMEDHLLKEESIVEVAEIENDPVEDEVSEKVDTDTESQADIVLNIPSSEEIKEELDNIFDKDKKLEEIIEQSEPQDENHFIDVKVPEKTYTDEDFELDSFPTKYIKQTIRSGQVINFEGNIVIIGDSHPGSEIVAAGDITVWGVLSGIAHSGSKGNQKARIRALKMNAIQLRIANCYARRPDALNAPFVEKSNTFVPEEARIVNGEIVIFKTND